MMKKPQNRGEMASRECNIIEIKKEDKFDQFRGRSAPLLYVKYEDHVLFKNCNPIEMDSTTREVVGWLTFETNDKICICYDKPVDPLPNEKRESGFVILKNDILEVYELIPNNPFKQTKLVDYGHKTQKMRK